MPLTMLIVDEEPVAAQTLAAVLEKAGYRALRAASVQQAGHLVQAHAPDIVILDDQVEGAHGFGQRLKRLRPSMPLLIFSSVPLDPKASDYADAFAGKPENPRRLLQRLAALVGRTRRPMQEHEWRHSDTLEAA